MKKTIFVFFFLVILSIVNFLRMIQIEKNTALQILDSLISLEYEIKPDISEEDGEKIYFSPRNYARRIAIMDCEQLIYEKYRLWQ